MKLTTILLFLTIAIGAVSATSLYSKGVLLTNRTTNSTALPAVKQRKAPTDSDGNQIIIDDPVMKKRTNRMMEMPGPPVAVPVFPTEFKCLVAWGKGNLLNFSAAKDGKQYTVLSTLTSEGLLFKTKELLLKDMNDKSVTKDKAKTVFMTSNKSENIGDYVIPSRKIIGCEVYPKIPDPMEFSYQILTMQDDKKDDISDQYTVTLKNDYKYLENQQANKMAFPVNGHQFCAKLTYGAETARATISKYRQLLFENLSSISADCSNALANSSDDKNFKASKASAIQSNEATVSKKEANVKIYDNYKNTIVTNIAEARKIIKEQEAIIKQQKADEIKFESDIILELNKISTYEANDKIMDEYIHTTKTQIVSNEKQKIDIDKKIADKAKVNKEEGTKSKTEAQAKVVEYNKQADAMAKSTRGITKYVTNSKNALANIMTTSCGISNLKSNDFQTVRNPLKQIYCTAGQNTVRKFRKSRGIESEFEELR